MKLTIENLKNLIRQVINEATQETEYNRIMNIFQGNVDSVDQVAILTPENPHAKAILPKQNEMRTKKFEEELASMGYGFRIISGMYEGPEDSYLVPHMTLEDAKKLSYKYAQESFIHSVKTLNEMDHTMYYIDFEGAKQDPAFPIQQYREVYIVPAQIPIKSEEFSGTISGNDEMASATNYYSHVPDKTWDTKKKGGEIRPGGYKRGKKFSIDFFKGSNQQGLPLSEPLKTPKYVREANYIFIKESSVPKTMEAQKLVKLIKELSKQICESNRLGSSKYQGRHRLLKAKRQLQEMIDKR